MSDEDMKVEAILGRYRPAGPPAELRDRVLRSSELRASRWARVGWLSMAAILVLSIGLYLATERVTRLTAAALGPSQAEWTPEAKEAAELFNGHGLGRRYIAIALAAGQPRTARSLQQNVPASLLKDIR